jgi:acylphosphatase
VPATKQLALRVKGLVQGVFFRQSAREQALRLGLGGWVRNTADGDVELLVQGPPGAVDRFVSWCHHGPPHARVDAVEVAESSTPEQFHTFRVIHG